MPSIGSSRRDPAPVEAVEQVALHDRADHLGRHHRRLLLHHRELRHAVLAHDRDGGADGLVRVDVDELRQRARLAGEHVPDRALVAAGGEEAVVGHPLVVEDLGQVAAAAVGQQHDDHVVRAGLAATRSAATTASPQEPPTSRPSSRASRRVI